jgi:phosphoribosylglycinamide formyltransferase-1
MTVSSNAISRELVSCPLPSGKGHDTSSSLVRIGVLASGSGSNFEALVHAFEFNPTIELVVLVCNEPEAYVLQRAKRLGIKSVCISHKAYTQRRLFDATVADALVEHKVQWVVMAGWMRLMGEDFLERFDRRVLNIHPSLLPSFKGLRALERSWRAGQKIVGCSVHWVVPQMDAGPLVGQAALSVEHGDSFEQLRERHARLEHLLYPQAILAALQTSHPPECPVE